MHSAKRCAFNKGVNEWRFKDEKIKLIIYFINFYKKYFDNQKPISNCCIIAIMVLILYIYKKPAQAGTAPAQSPSYGLEGWEYQSLLPFRWNGALRPLKLNYSYCCIYQVALTLITLMLLVLYNIFTSVELLISSITSGVE